MFVGATSGTDFSLCRFRDPDRKKHRLKSVPLAALQFFDPFQQPVDFLFVGVARTADAKQALVAEA